VAHHELLARVAHLELDARLLRPAGVLAFEEMPEEALLQALALARVEAFPVRAAMRLEPLVLRRGLHEAFEVAARMQPLPAPVRRGEQRHLDLAPVRRALAAGAIVARVREDVRLVVDAVARELLVAELLRAAHQLAGDAALRAALAQAVLHAVDRPREPVGEEAREDAAVPDRFAVVIARALPAADRREMRRLEAGHLPGVHRVVGNAV
jgi:hypothetical protein